MSNRPPDQDVDELVSRLREGAPGETDAAGVARIRSSIARPRSRKWGVRMVAIAALAAAVGVTFAVWPRTPDKLQPVQAFAYDRAAQAVAPMDGVLHFKLSVETTPVGPTSLVIDNGVTVTAEYPTDTTNATEAWLDFGNGLTRRESASGYPASMSTLWIDDPDRTLIVDYIPDADQLLISERLKLEHENESSLMELEWLGWAWTQSFARALEERSCDVTECVTQEGTEAWCVTWTENVPGEFETVTTYSALFRRTDYRPLGLDAHTEYAFNRYPEPNVTDTHVEVEVWETLDRDDVPDDLFETHTDFEDTSASYSVMMVPDDPRINEVGFPVWRAGDGLDLPPASTARFGRGDLVGYRGNISPFQLHKSGLLTLYYGDFDWWVPAPGLVSVTSYASSDPADVEEFWASQMQRAEQVSGDVEDRSFRMRSSTDEAVLMASVDGSAVLISGPDEETVLAVLGSLELVE